MVIRRASNRSVCMTVSGSSIECVCLLPSHAEQRQMTAYIQDFQVSG